MAGNLSAVDNAATPETHDVVMGLGHDAMPMILGSIRHIIALRNAWRPELQVTISMVLTTDNIHEAARFVDLGNELGVSRVYLRTLMPLNTLDHAPRGLNYHLQPPILRPEFARYAESAREAISRSTVAVEAYPDAWATECDQRRRP